jgi:ankyrin repeat protein
MRKINIKNNALTVVLITALYIALFGMFAYQQTEIRPYVQSVNFILNKKHYGNFLYFESSKGNIDKVKRVLDAGVDPNTKHYAGGVPIIFAAQLGKADIVELLLDYGAEATNTDSRGKTVLDYAIEHANNGSNEFARIVKRLRNEKGIQL